MQLPNALPWARMFRRARSEYWSAAAQAIMAVMAWCVHDIWLFLATAAPFTIRNELTKNYTVIWWHSAKHLANQISILSTNARALKIQVTGWLSTRCLDSALSHQFENHLSQSWKHWKVLQLQSLGKNCLLFLPIYKWKLSWISFNLYAALIFPAVGTLKMDRNQLKTANQIQLFSQFLQSY